MTHVALGLGVERPLGACVCPGCRTGQRGGGGTLLNEKEGRKAKRSRWREGPGVDKEGQPARNTRTPVGSSLLLRGWGSVQPSRLGRSHLTALFSLVRPPGSQLTQVSFSPGKHRPVFG